MERLTHRNDDGTILIKRRGVAHDGFSNYMLPSDIAAVRRLAAYEDTGLEPEEIKEILERYRGFRSAISDETGQPIVSWGRAGTICKADKEGRLLVLPCIRPFDNGVYGTAYEVLWWEERSGFMTKSFLTREEAEAALAKGGEG